MRLDSLRITILAGFFFIVLSGMALTVFFLMERSSTKVTRQQNNFARGLLEYDIQLMELSGTQEEFNRLNRDLDRLEKMTISVESWLSVLKRRRALTRFHPPSLENYRKSIGRAQEAFPMSEAVAALAVEALVKNTAINREVENEVRHLLSLFIGNSFNNLRLGLHIILGDFRNPQRALLLPHDLVSDGTESVTVNFALMKILRDDIRGAVVDVQTMLQSGIITDDTLRLAAEFYYDFGDLNTSAEIFSMMNDEWAMSRQADALYLAGYIGSARTIWSILSDAPLVTTPLIALAERSLYNLGVTSLESDEAAFWFEKLVFLDAESIAGSRQFGLIRYTRLLERHEAITVLENLQPRNNPLIDLEICRRQARDWELGRQIAEAWLLLDRHDENEHLYHWAAWLFLFQRNYSEIKILLHRSETLQFSEWVDVYRAIELMFEGDLDTAETILRAIPVQYTQWPVFANLGRIFEAWRSPGRALEQYRLAAERVQNPRTAARLQTRIARCYSALNRPTDAILALQDALDFDPENMTAKLELDRILIIY